MDAVKQSPNGEKNVVSLTVDEELRDLEIDGYKLVFSTRVALMPVALADVRTTESNGNE